MGLRRPGLIFNYLILNHTITQSSLATPLVDEVGDEAGPAGLVAGAEAGAGVPMEVLVKQKVVAPMGIVLKFFGVAVDRAPSIGTMLEDVDHAVGYFF